jgi:hypothetical protein
MRVRYMPHHLRWPGRVSSAYHFKRALYEIEDAIHSHRLEAFIGHVVFLDLYFDLRSIHTILTALNPQFPNYFS